MKYSLTSILLSTFFILSSCSNKTVTQVDTSAAELSQQMVTSVLWYQRSAEMVAAYHQAYNYAQLMLNAKLDTVSLNKAAAVVLDIDETVLDNSPYQVSLIKNQAQYDPTTWKNWTTKARAEALPGALEFTTYAKSRGVQVFYISNRREDELQATLKNLQELGFPNATDRFVLLRDESSDKTARRETVQNAYEVLVFVGDNLADYQEQYANRTVQNERQMVLSNIEQLLNHFVILPNPMYGDWERALYENNYGLSPQQKIDRRLNALED